MYKVIHRFADIQDNKYVYEVGDEFPREGFKADDKRIEELASNKNKVGKTLIEEVEPPIIEVDIEPVDELEPKTEKAKKTAKK